jgi:hypothetical protein
MAESMVRKAGKSRNFPEDFRGQPANLIRKIRKTPFRGFPTFRLALLPVDSSVDDKDDGQSEAGVQALVQADVLSHSPRGGDVPTIRFSRGLCDAGITEPRQVALKAKIEIENPFCRRGGFPTTSQEDQTWKI